jgi:arylsulfatase A-like enzyme
VFRSALGEFAARLAPVHRLIAFLVIPLLAISVVALAWVLWPSTEPDVAEEPVEVSLRASPASESGPANNILILVTDDQGIDQVGVYGEHPNPPPTPNIDRLAAEGVLFRNAWSSPTCSPSRGSILTGRLPRRTGVGAVIHPRQDFELPLSEVTMARMLEGASRSWAAVAIGKWHLAGRSSRNNIRHPNLAGFDHYAGTIANVGQATRNHHGDLSYVHWEKVTDGKRAISEVYATTDTVNDALEQIRSLPEPWLVYVAFNAPHSPWHVPPTRLHNQDVGPDASDADKYRAMVEALDMEIGRLLREMGPKRDNTTVIFLSDNGTPDETTLPPWPADRAKNTPFEGGVNVPLIITGPQVSQPGSESDALVHVADVFATVADIAGVTLGPEATGPMRGVTIDGRSLLPHVRGASQEARAVVHTEKFIPNGLGPNKRVDWRMSRNAELKLIDSSEHGFLVWDIRDGEDQGDGMRPRAVPRALRSSWRQLRTAHERHFGGDSPGQTASGSAGKRRK